MSKKVLYLSRNEGEDVQLTSKRPKRKYYPATPCYCGDAACTYNKPAGKRFDNEDSVFEFCTSGLEDAGIKIKPGQLVKVRLEVVQ